MRPNFLLQSIANESRSGRTSSFGMEAIAPQLNDKAMLEFTAVIGKMREDFNTNGLKSLPGLLEELSKIASKRFGIPMVFKNVYGAGPMTMTYSLLDKSTGFDNTSDFVKNWFITTMSPMGKRLKTQSELFSKYMLDHEIYIDLKRAYITGLPDDYDCEIMCDWYALFDPNNVLYADDDRMLTGVFLHEIGHVFSRLELAHRTRRSFIAIEEATHDLVKNKTNAGYKYALAYKETWNPGFKAEDYKNADIKTIVMGVIKDVKDRYSFELAGERSGTAMEVVADIFPSRFGYGEYVSSYLKKIELEFGNHHVDGSNASLFGAVVIMALLTLPGVVMLGGVASIVTGVAWFGCFALGTINAVAKHPFLTYEIPYLRAETFYLDAIRQLRVYADKLPIEEKKRLIKSIDNIKATMQAIKDQGGYTSTYPVQKFFEFLNSRLKTAREISDYMESISRLMENPLHADQHRF